MITIPKIDSNSTNGEVDATANAILSVLAQDDWSADAYLTATQSQISESYEALSEAIKRNSTESELDEKDQARDEALRNLFTLTKGLATLSNDTGANANKILALLEHYGLSATIKANYANETAYINSMLKDLQSDEYMPIILQEVYLQDAMAALATAQATFESAHKDYAIMTKEASTKESATALKSTVMRLINTELVEFLRVMIKVQPDTYSDLAKQVGGIIDDNNERVKRRKSATNDDETEALSTSSEE